MKPKFIITTIVGKRYQYTAYKKKNLNITPATISFDFEISVESSGDFSEYVKKGVLDSSKIKRGILEGDIDIIGKRSSF